MHVGDVHRREKLISYIFSYFNMMLLILVKQRSGDSYLYCHKRFYIKQGG